MLECSVRQDAALGPVATARWDIAVSAWVDRLVREIPEDQRVLVERYTQRLLQLVRRKLPERFRGRVDPEDVVQSVYRSFFARVRAEEYAFAESLDVWRLLMVMTLHKVDNTMKHHLRLRRDVRREATPSDTVLERTALRDIEPGPEDLAELCDLLEDLLVNLPPAYRDVVTLRLAGHSHDEIAGQVGVSKRTVQRVLSNVQSSACKRWGVTHA
jgi:RNA polymerase sigma-70 factor (ECF subfamily)